MKKDDNSIIGLYDLVSDKIPVLSNIIEKDFNKSSAKFINYYVNLPNICGERYIFPEKEIDEVINKLGYEHKEFQKEINSRSFDANFKTINNKNSMLLLFLCRYYADRNQTKQAMQMSLFLTFRLFSGLMFKYFKTGCNISVMSYTINNMSNYFQLGKNDGNIILTLTQINESIYTKYSSLLTSGDNKKFTEYLSNLRTRINASLQNTASAYYKVFHEKLYLSTHSTVVDAETGDNISEFSNNNDFINKIKLNTRDYINSNGNDEIIIRKVVNASGVKQTTMDELYLRVIKNPVELDKISTAIFKTLGKNLDKKVCSKTFIIENLRALSSKYNDSLIKPVISESLEKNLTGYKALASSTQSKIKRALLISILLFIQKSNCGRG